MKIVIPCGVHLAKSWVISVPVWALPVPRNQSVVKALVPFALNIRPAVPLPVAFGSELNHPPKMKPGLTGGVTLAGNGVLLVWLKPPVGVTMGPPVLPRWLIVMSEIVATHLANMLCAAGVFMSVAVVIWPTVPVPFALAWVLNQPPKPNPIGVWARVGAVKDAAV
jgi:hypothetical protein